jgi:hypothetical protein
MASNGARPGCALANGGGRADARRARRLEALDQRVGDRHHRVAVGDRRAGAEVVLRR